tara:strand:+ start:1100 stop:1315 length:216 start_codon:yes stop_codon:yes gene_type:complete
MFLVLVGDDVLTGGCVDEMIFVRRNFGQPKRSQHHMGSTHASAAAAATGPVHTNDVHAEANAEANDGGECR